MKTAVQELFTKLEKEHPSLFNIHSVIGREFINDYYQFLEMEKQQIIEAYDAEWIETIKNGMDYYSETFKQDETD
jgi:hypothetical protein